MPSPRRIKTCTYCNSQWATRSSTARTCSPLCRARLREQEHGSTKGASPREYPPELVRQIQSMYESGKTIREIQDRVKGAKVQNVIKRYGIETRPTIKRDQRREKNDSWKGDEATYSAFHLRVQVARGKPQKCDQCGITGPGLYEWANLTGHYEQISDYGRMCVPCHRKYDAKRRKETGRRTSPQRR